MFRRLLHFLIMSALLLGLSGRAAADAAEDPRELDGHLFLPSAVIADPFVTLHLGSQTGFGYAQGRWSDATNPAQPLDFQLGVLSQEVALQVPILPQWALRVRLSGGLLAGINSDAVLSYGLDLGYGISAGTLVSFRLKGLRLGATVDGQFSPTYNFNFFNAIDDSLAAMTINTSTLLDKRNDGRISAAMLAATAFHRALGLLTELRYLHAFHQQDGRSTNQGQLLFGAALSFDIGALSKAPLGLLASYRLGVPLTRLPELNHDASLGLFFTGRKALAAGVDCTLSFASPQSALRLLTIVGVVVLRHYF